MAQIPVKTEPEQEMESDNGSASDRDSIHLPVFSEKLELCEIVKKEEPIDRHELIDSYERLDTEEDPLFINKPEGSPDTLEQHNACGENDRKRCSEQKVLAWTINSNSEPCTSHADNSIESSTSKMNKRRRVLPNDKMPVEGFYNKTSTRSKWLAPPSCADSDIEVEDDELLDEYLDDDIGDPDFLLDIPYDDFFPTGSVERVRPQNMPVEDSDEDSAEENQDAPAPPTKRKKSTRVCVKERKWEKKDIASAPLPPFQHPMPSCIRSPIEYFHDMFTMDLVEDIVYQTNLYAKQKNVNTTFSMDTHEFMVFLGVVLYMGVTQLPAIEDYWGMHTRVPQVADAMSSKRFRLIRSLLHFNNNENLGGVTDRFFKIRPVINSIVKQFLRVKGTSTQSVDEVMVTYKGTRAGNLRQYIQTKPDKWGYKLFCRASIDGFIHDILIYQGETTFSSHHQQLTQEESELPVSSKTVLVLAKTMQTPSQASIYADNYFTSIELVEYLREKLQCRYVGTARVNRVGRAPLISVKDMEKKTVRRGTYDYKSSNGVLALRWKDNKIVTMLSSDVGLKPVKTVKRYDRTAKKKIYVDCPNIIKEYNGKMGGIDKSEMLTHLYKTPFRSRRYYMRIFGYVLDLCVCNAWILYKRDCKALKEKAMPLKVFRIDMSRFAQCQKTMVQRSTRLSAELPLVLPRRGQKTQLPTDQCRYDTSKSHMPTFVTNRQTCKYCSNKDEVHRSRWMCDVCQVALCLTDTRNCFKLFHFQEPQPSTSASATSP